MIVLCSHSSLYYMSLSIITFSLVHFIFPNMPLLILWLICIYIYMYVHIICVLLNLVIHMKKIWYFTVSCSKRRFLHFVEYIRKRKKLARAFFLFAFVCMSYCLSGVYSANREVLAVNVTVLSFAAGSLSSVESLRVPELRNPQLQKRQHCGEQPSEVHRDCPS